jgi:hypothetical protein
MMSDLMEELTATLTDHYLVVAKVRERLSVSKRTEKERFHLKKQSNMSDSQLPKKYSAPCSQSVSQSVISSEPYFCSNCMLGSPI